MRGPISKRELKALAPPRLVRARPAKGYRRHWLLLGLLLSAGCAVAAFWFHTAPWPLPIFNQPQPVALATEPDRHALPADTLELKEKRRFPRLEFQNLSAAINQPLPLGIVLTNSTGGETLVLSGFVEGTSLSAGTALSTTRWSLPGHDLDKTFISAPHDFNGIMQVAVTLYSSAQDVLETKEVRFEWSSSRKGDKLPVTVSPATSFSR